MREVAFLKQNAAKWRKFEAQLLNINNVTPDELTDLYIQITDDLSHCRTFYPHSKSTLYLNGLAVKVHQAIYKNKREDYGRIFRFWSREVPQAVADSFGSLKLAFLIFIISTLYGIGSTLYNDAYPRAILGDHYVEQTIENIRNGTPMAIYADTEESEMFFRISWNNVKVALNTYVLGLFFGFGSGYVLLKNGVMVGAFESLLFQYGAGTESLLTVWIHGTIEISTIIVAGAAGLTLGAGFLFPGTYSRRQSFINAGKRSIKIMMGIIPLIVLAAVFESFVTRHSGYAMKDTVEVAPILSGTIIAASLAFVIWYFVLLPLRLRRESKVTAPEISLEHLARMAVTVQN